MVRHNFSIWHCTSVLYASFLHILYVSGHINWTMYGSIQFTWLQNQMLMLYLFGCTVFKWVEFILEFFHEYIFRNLSILVFSIVPRFFHYEYTHGNSTFVTTSLSRDKSYNQFWHAWQSLTSTFIPFTALGTINVKILWNLAKSKLNDAEMSQNDGLRIHIGWEYEISRINNSMNLVVKKFFGGVF